MLEVLAAAKFHEKTVKDLEAVRGEMAAKRGGFEERITWWK
ncbi:hypothetical protein QTL97_16905 [Sporosarcina thermotolerans]|uniref:Uncharacterized protein n=1 Tax=Sporosarcina thermotolerans TaxID=633404 RepID=A0AAW9AB15_9BACL|nr:hypothetical protein [Sporosarcina thermotolerans]MDW0118607.1 hypothetical protein [Sporosarcina thermotolerans]WHT49601.1 hypothetical protein QNH10_08905 [Sporosarcina thermotolerans]